MDRMDEMDVLRGMWFHYSMETLQLLAVALGLASLAGMRLYLTVFLTGLAIHCQWITLAPQYQALLPLGHPILIGLSGTLCLVEFIADKVPWVDSLWDSIHTVIRPVAGAALALKAFGQTTPLFDVALGLLAGTVSLSLHGTKAGVRLLANGSPEPFSNFFLSLAEELVVIGGLVLLYVNPVIALVVLALFLSAIGWFAPKLWRSIRVVIWLFWSKLRWPASGPEPATDAQLPKEIPSRLESAFKIHNVLHEEVLWAVPCVSTSSKFLPPNMFGALVATEQSPRALTFVGKRGFSTFTKALDVADCKPSQQSQFLSENLVLECAESQKRMVFLFPRSEAERVRQVVESLEKRLAL